MKAPKNIIADVVVAGHICLDIILPFAQEVSDLSSLIVPGRCVTIGDALVTTGGSVANTGQALHQLGISTRLIAKVGNDSFGQSILDILKKNHESLLAGMLIVPGETSAYSIVLSPSGIDRSFLYHPGANDRFVAADISDESLEGARFFHFGYPPEMRQMYAEDGKELKKLMSRVKQRGLCTSMDMANPDSNREAGNIDWRNLLKGVLPYVDIFLPSFEEIYYMLDRSGHRDWRAKNLPVDISLAQSMADELLEMGAAIVVIKLGEKGLLLKSTDDLNRLQESNIEQSELWLNLQIHAPSFVAEVASTTGAGDCSIAGFLAGISKGLTPEEVLKMAAAVGAFSVENMDASTGVPHWDKVKERIAQGWAVHT